MQMHQIWSSNIRLFLWEDGIFAKQTNGVHMKSGYHLFIFHICEMSAGDCVCARSFACRFGEPFFYCQLTWHHLSRFIFIGQPRNIFGIYRAKIERNNDENWENKSHRKEEVDVVPVNNANALSAPHTHIATTAIMMAMFD